MATAAGIWCAENQVTLVNEFMSEAPDATGPILYNLLNHMPKRIYLDVTRRGNSGYCLLADKLVATPKDLDIYSAGTMCTDYSMLNTLNPKKNLG